jgi:hypothetical protein
MFDYSDRTAYMALGGGVGAVTVLDGGGHD